MDDTKKTASGFKDRRIGEDRRKAQMPFEGPDRRKGDRRSGADRRANPRISAQ